MSPDFSRQHKRVLLSSRRSVRHASHQQLAQPHPPLFPLSDTTQSEKGAGQRGSKVVPSQGAADRGGTDL